MADQDSDEGELTLQTLLNKSVKQTEVVVEKMKLGTKESIDDTLKNTKRDAQWIAAASSKLSVLIKELEQLRKHSHPLVRKQLAESLDLLLTTCFKYVIFFQLLLEQSLETLTFFFIITGI